MRYSHNITLIRKRKHALKISVLFTFFIIIVILVVGFTALDAREFFLGFAFSLFRVCISYSIALIFAIILLLGSTYSEKIEVISIPILDVLQSFPSFALFPLFVVWFGKNSIVTIFILIITMIWPILFTLLTAKKQIRQDLIEAAYTLQARGYKYYLFVFFPLLLPALVTGSIVSWGEAWEAIIAAEIIVGVPGVGTYLAQAGSAHHIHILSVGILILLLMLFLINKYVWLSLLNSSTKYQLE